MGKDDVNLKTVKCNTCDNKMEVDKNARGGYCYLCVASGRAFMLPEALAKAPSNETLLYDDNFAAGLQPVSRKETTYKYGKKVKENKHSVRFGQTTKIDKYLMEGLSDEEILKRCPKEIPEYKGNWLKLLNLRKYHFKIKKAKNV